MAYDSSPLRREEADMTQAAGGQVGFPGAAGFRAEPDYRGESAFPASGYPVAEGTAAVPAAVLDDVFDDPADGTPGRDRLGVHWMWELVLLLAVASLAALVWQAQPDALRGDDLSQLLVAATGFGLLGLAAGVSLRAGAPNLAIGPVAVAAGIYFAQRGAEGVVPPTLMALVTALVLGAVTAVLVVGVHVPGWAASLAAAGAGVVWLYQQPPEVALAGGFDPTGRAMVLFVAFVAVGAVGGLLGTVKPIRRALGRFRPVGDPARRRGLAAALLTTMAIMLSMALAVVGGVILVAGSDAPVQGSAGTQWFEYGLIGFAVALVGGTSAFGRRGGVFGTTLAVLAFVLFDRYQQAMGWSIALLATASVAVAVGLVVTRLVERFGRPASADSDEATWATSPAAPRPEPMAGTHAADTWGSGTDSWASSLPAQPARDPNPWEERWPR
jgi:ribose/xylose/arabinose/galactoside ABC-type transport system permease subunit